MKTYLFLLVLVSYGCCLQFEDDAVNVEQQNQAKQSGFFPSVDAPDERFSEISGINYIDPQTLYNQNRKQLNFNGNPNRYAPPGGNQLYQPSPYRPSPSTNKSPVSVSYVRKRPTKRPYQYAGQPSNYYSSYPSDQSNPFYQNYANHYQYPSGAAPSYPDYYNPTRFPSPTNANLNAQPQILHQPSLQYPNYYTNNYANQFDYQRPSSGYGNGGGGGSGISNFFNNIREASGNGPLGQFSQVSGQFGKALEDISENDDLQCVPKVLCQMVQSQRRPGQLPSFMNVPGLSTIISALPSTSPLMNFGRAALLGLSGSGDCDAAYPRCPRDEEQMLYYLNNHRGGFFRFFNGGNSFGDDSQIQQQLSQQLNSQQQAGADQGLNLGALQALADTLNQGNGINLGNLFSSPSNQRPAASNYQGSPAPQPQSSGLLGMFQSNTLSDIVSNLLTGVVGNRFSRRLNKRSLPDESAAEGHHKIEKRIVNLKATDAHRYLAQAEQNFFQESSNDQQQNTLYSLEEPFTFSNGNRINNAHQYQVMKFPKNEIRPQEVRLSEINQGNFISPSDIARTLKALFPEAVGQLRFDNDQFNRELLRALVNDRLGKILTGVQQQRPINNNYDTNRYQGSQTSDYNKYSVLNYPAQSQNYAGSGSSNYNNFNTNHINRGQQQSSNADRSRIVYITNSRGQNEFTLNEATGEKKRI